MLTWYIVNCLWNYHQIYSFGAIRDEYELIRCSRSKVKVTVRSRTVQLNNHFGRLFLTCLRNAALQEHILMKLITTSLRDLLTFARSRVQRSKSQTTFTKTLFSGADLGASNPLEAMEQVPLVLSLPSLISLSYLPSLPSLNPPPHLPTFSASKLSPYVQLGAMGTRWAPLAGPDEGRPPTIVVYVELK